MEMWLELAVSMLYGLIIVLPLVVKVIETVREAAKEKDWGKLCGLLSEYMSEAEKKFDDGATRKEWVMAMIEVAAKNMNYNVDMDVISDLIDQLCEMSKVVNTEIAKNK